MDWEVAGPMVRRGELPHLERLIEEGATLPLAAEPPFSSPALWTTLATGVRRERHGVLDFVYLPAGGEAQLPATSGLRTRLAFWEVLSRLERPVVVVGWYASDPADAVLGVLVSDKAGPGPARAGQIHPPALEGVELLAEIPGVEEAAGAVLARLDEGAGVPGGAPGLDNTRETVERDLYRVRAAAALARSERPAVVACYLQGVDAASHFYWSHHAPRAAEYLVRPSAEAVRVLGGTVEDTYRMADAALGALREAVGEDASVLLMSDHGFRPFAPPDSILVDLDLLLSEMGWLSFEDPSAPRKERRPVVARSALFSSAGTGIVDPFSTRARYLYWNPDAPGAPDLGEVRSTLRRLRTEEGRRFFAVVERLEGIAAAPGVDPPDLAVRVSPDVVGDRAVRLPGGGALPLQRILYQFGDISGTHRPEALLLVRAPGVAAGGAPGGTMSMADTGALLLRLAGAPLADDLDGRIPADLFSGEQERPRVRSYEEWFPRRAAAAPGGEGDEEGLLERLRSLGYIQ
jgi:hypothetical protein